MFPELFKLPWWGLSVYTYALMVGSGCVALVLTTMRFASQQGIDRTRIYDLALWLMPSVFLGTKTLMIGQLWTGIVHKRPGLSLSTILDAPGFYLGGFLAALIVSVILARVWNLSWFVIADSTAPGLALANALGRIGCFAAGCCWGQPTASWIGVKFSERAHEITGVPGGVPLIPTQLFDSAANLMIFAFLLWFWKRRAFSGQMILFFMILYSLERFIVESWRADPRGQVMSLSTSQFLSLWIICFSIPLYLWLRATRARRAYATVHL